MKFIEGLPDPMFEKHALITYEERDKLEFFWTFGGWAYYKESTNELFNEYCRLIPCDAYKHLLSQGLIDKNKNKIKIGY